MHKAIIINGYNALDPISISLYISVWKFYVNPYKELWCLQIVNAIALNMIWSDVYNMLGTKNPVTHMHAVKICFRLHDTNETFSWAIGLKKTKSQNLNEFCISTLLHIFAALPIDWLGFKRAQLNVYMCNIIYRNGPLHLPNSNKTQFYFF